ncbi:class F sortase, partial [Streptomyces ardesiacus]|uniref:class F sortase n=1 Tax=Streptomyces ardesiacus TaxID=285564 RepID=UPI00362FC2D6
MYDSELAEEEERRRKRAPWGVIALVLLTGLALIRNGSGEFDVGPPQPASAAAAPDTRAAPGDAAAPGVTPLPYAVPDRVSIPAIQVDAPVMGVGLDADGWVDAPPPEDPNLAGWFTGAVSPGEKGTAVVVGHVDNQQGPAVFYGLGALKKGNKVEIHRQDGKTAVFEIYGIEVFEKDNFPGDRVYGSKGTP